MRNKEPAKDARKLKELEAEIGSRFIFMNRLQKMFSDADFYSSWQDLDKEDYGALMKLILEHGAPTEVKEKEERRIITLS